MTASNNKYQDNGFKISGINGEPINTEWQEFYNKFVNEKNLTDIIINYAISQFNTHKKIIDFNTQSSICFGIDTRPSSKPLFTIFK